MRRGGYDNRSRAADTAEISQPGRCTTIGDNVTPSQSYLMSIRAACRTDPCVMLAARTLISIFYVISTMVASEKVTTFRLKSLLRNEWICCELAKTKLTRSTSSLETENQHHSMSCFARRARRCGNRSEALDQELEPRQQ
jgi:hypothetical protein